MKSHSPQACFAVLILASVLFSACALPVSETPSFYAFIDKPEEGAVLFRGSITIRGVSNSRGAAASYMAFFVNGSRIGQTTSLSSSFVPGSRHAAWIWYPPAAGEYFLQVQAARYRGAGGSAFSEAVRVCVLDFDIGFGTRTYGYTGPCNVSRTEFTSPGEITMGASAVPDSLTYEPLDSYGSCPEFSNPSINFRVDVNDPPDDVAYVAVEYSIPPIPFYVLHSATLVLTHLGGVPPAELYLGHTESALYFDIGDALQGTTGELIWTARAFRRDGTVILEDGPNTIPITPCDYVPPTATLIAAPVIIAPTETFTLTPSELNCPPGTYYAPVTNRCIAIQTKTPKPGGGGDKCSSYTGNLACIAAGCSWDPVKKTCS